MRERTRTDSGSAGQDAATNSQLLQAGAALSDNDPRRALKLARQAVRGATDPLVIARGCYYQAAALLDLGRLAEAEDRVSSGFHALGQYGGCERAMLLTARGSLASERRLFDEARDAFDEAESLFHQMTEPCSVQLASVKLFASQVEMLSGNHAQAVARLTELFDSLGSDHPERGGTAYWLSLATGLGGDTDSALGWAERCRVEAEKRNDAGGLFDARLLFARWLLDVGEARDCVAYADEHYDDEPYYLAEARICLAAILSVSDPRGALEALRDADPYVAASGSLWLRQSLHIIEERACKGVVTDEGGELRVRMSTDPPPLDVVEGVFERWIKRTAVRVFGTAKAAGDAFGRHKSNMAPRRPKRKKGLEPEGSDD
jgi:tetratricopeptide (TPR) repeat protein